MSKEDFELIKVIGRGAYGKVYMVNHRASKKIFAMKSIKKSRVIETDQIEGTRGKKNLTKYQYFECS